jgi:flagellar biosynthesis chaperone FliJ
MARPQIYLDRLIPIHAARERRAQQEFHLRIQSHESARLAHSSILRDLRALEHAIEQSLAYAFNGQAQSAGDAQAAIAVAQLNQTKAHVAQSEVTTAQATVEQALQALDEARHQYANQVRTGHKMRETCGRQSAVLRVAVEKRNEELMDDEFVPFWMIRQKERGPT